MKLPLQKIRLLDFKTKEEENIIQEVVNIKVSQLPPETSVQRNDVPDIRTKEQEEHWQKIIDERNAALKPKVEVTADETGIGIKVEEPIEQQIEKKEEELKVLNQELAEFKCGKCEFVGKNKKSLTFHTTKKHAAA